MQMKQELAAVSLDAVRIRIVAVLPGQIRSCLDQLSDEQIWWRPNEHSNSIGNLVLHISGSILYYLCRRVGGFAYERHRDAEFAERVPVPKPRLFELFNGAIEKASATFDRLTASQLSEPSTTPEYYSLLFEDLLGVLFHFATHAGQIVYITKMLQEGSLDELWMKAHKTAGVWKT